MISIPLQATRFDLFCAEAKEVNVAGSFNGWSLNQKLQSLGMGHWCLETNLAPGRHEYRFIVEGVWRSDPYAKLTAPNPFGSVNSILLVEPSEESKLLHEVH